MSPSGYEALPLGGPAPPRAPSHAGLLRRLRGGSSLRLRAVLLALAVGAVLLVRNSNQAKAVLAAGGYGRPEDVGVGEVGEGPEDAQLVEPVKVIQFPPPQPCNAPTSYQDGDGQLWLSPSPALPLTATLAERIATWRASPIANQSTWLDFNAQTCTISPSDHRERERKTWATIDAARVVTLREQLIASLDRAATNGNLTLPSQLKGTRGLVYTAGNADTFQRVIIALKLLRHHGTTLPAEVFHFASEEEPVAAEDVARLTELGATVREVHGVRKEADSERSKSFHIKGAALVQSGFEQVLMMDSDSMAAADPTVLFDAPGYKQAGAMLWPDFWREDGANAVWAILGIQCRDEWTTEAGQILVDKSKHMDVLWLVQTMLEDWKLWFDISDGDKDLFRYALLMLRKRWAVPGRHVASASWSSNDEIRQRKGFCGHTMIQHDHAGEPLFVHANLLKRIVGNFQGSGGTWARTLQLALPAFPAPAPAGADAEPAPKEQVEGGARYDTRVGMWKNRKGEGSWRGPPPGQERKAMRVKPEGDAKREGQGEARADEGVAEERTTNSAESGEGEEEEGEADEEQDLPLEAEEDEAEAGRALVPDLAPAADAEPASQGQNAEDDDDTTTPAGDFVLRRQLLNPLSTLASFPTMADHLANPLLPSGLGLLPAPRHVRQRALLEPRLAPAFWSGHRGVNYVLCVESELRAEAELRREESGDGMCGLEEWGEGEVEGGMEVVWWRDSGRLRGFEELFYEVGGRANGFGF